MHTQFFTLSRKVFPSTYFPPLRALALALLLATPCFPALAQDEHAGEAAHEGEAHAEEEGHNENEIHLTDSQRGRLDIRVAPAESGSAAALVEAPATVHFNADRIARLGPLLESKVVEVTRDLGDRVEGGETVAILESVELGRAKARYLSAAARLEAAEAEYRRDETLAEQQITSQADLLESRSAYLQARAERDATRAELRLYGLEEGAIDAISAGGEEPLSRYRLTAPISGVIQRRDLVRGQTLSSRETPIHIVNNETMWAMVEAYEQALPRLAAGQPVELTVRALPDRVFQGRTDWVSRELDEESRTVRVRAVIPNENGLLRAGMFGSARILTEGEEEYPLVPVDAVQTLEGDEQVVFVPAEEAGAFLAVPVQTGQESAGLIEITQGLQAGDQVVTNGAFDLMSAMTASGRSAAHSH